jgi:glutaredoxin
MSNQLTIYGTPWCSHSQAARNDLAAFAPEFINCQQFDEICEKAGIKNYPTIFNGDKNIEGWPLVGQGDAKPFMHVLGLQ